MTLDRDLQLLKELTQIHGISGDEEEVAKYLEKFYQNHGKVLRDNVGNIYLYKASKKANPLKVMVAAHMDEVGFIVKDIKANGAIEVLSIGGIFDQTLLSKRVTIKTDDGKLITGCFSVMPPHFLPESARSKPISIENMIIDVGASSKDEVLAMGIDYGNSIVIDGSFEIINNNKVLAKALDNRVGCALSVSLLEELSKLDLDYDLYIGANVQEEVGLRGAEVSANWIKPDFCVVLECSPSTDLFVNNNVNGKLGEGVLIRFHDRGMLPNKKLLKDFKQICVNNDIKHQMFYSLGGTDAIKIHLKDKGIPCLVTCIPGRNMHSCSSIIDMRDYQSAKESLIIFLSNLTTEQIKSYLRFNGN